MSVGRWCLPAARPRRAGDAARRLRQGVLSQGRLRVCVSMVVIQRRLVVVVGGRVTVSVVHVVHLQVCLGISAGQQPSDTERMWCGRVSCRLLFQLSIVLKRQRRVFGQAQLWRSVQLCQQLVAHLLFFSRSRSTTARFFVTMFTLIVSSAVVSVRLSCLLRLTQRFFLFILESFLSSQEAAVLEHVSTIGMQGPEGPFAWFIRCPRYFDKTIVKGERMPYRILPALLVLSIKWK